MVIICHRISVLHNVLIVIAVFILTVLETANYGVAQVISMVYVNSTLGVADLAVFLSVRTRI